MPRTSNRRKKQMFPFGYLMIPIVGFVGIGLLFFGIKMFFIPEKKDPYISYVKQAEVDSPNNPSVIAENETSNVTTEGMVAVPVVREGDPLPAKTTSSQSPPKPKASPSQGRPQSTTVRPSSSIPVRTDWLVQIGSFKQKSMADSLASEVKSKGFKPTVGHGEVDGTIYYRVLLPGGESRSEAQSLGERLSAMGYPYFVFPKK